MADLVSASVQGRVALRPRAGARVRRIGDEAELLEMLWMSRAVPLESISALSRYAEARVLGT